MKYLILSILLFFVLQSQDPARQAYQHYQNNNFEEAEKGFRTALENNPNDPRLWYNLGNTLAQLGNMEEARQVWQRFQSLETNPRDRARADYNLGNLYSNQEDYQKALEAYRNALRNAPDDQDSRHNFELARRLLQEQEQQQDQQQQEQDQSMQQDHLPQDGDQQQQQQQQDQQQTPQPQDGDQQDQQQEGQPQPQEGQLTLEEADNMLNALDNIEKDLIRDFQERQMDPSERNEKDW